MSEHDAIVLTRSLLRFETVNPPGRERDCARHAGALLADWGFHVEYHEYAEARTSVIARAGGSEAKAPLCLTGHLDVVPLGSNAWTRDPFAGETQGDRLYGRGSSDMKAGIAAMLLAAKSLAKKIPGTPGIVLVLTAAEEGGCIGSYHLAQTRLLGSAGAMIVGEPTSNYPYVGHKGSLKFYAGFRGTSAHGSMPELGVNAIYKAAPAVWTSAEDEWVRSVFEICQRHLGAQPEPRTAAYNTDAGNLLKVYRDAPTVVLGPGEPQLAHQTDEYCSMERIRQAVALYEEVIRRWCGI